MVNAIGYVTFLTYELNHKFSIRKNHNVIKIHSYKEVADQYNRPAYEVTCKYSIYLPAHYECKSLEDYTGRVYPFLEQFLRNITRTEVHSLTYKEPPIRSRRKKAKDSGE